MDRIFAHECVGRLDSQLFLTTLVIRVHQFELNLPAQVAERVTCLNRLEDLDATPVIAAGHGLLGGIVRVLQILNHSLLLIVAGAGSEQRQHHHE